MLVEPLNSSAADRINKSQVLASSNNPATTKKATVMDETFYSDSRSIINKSNVNISVFGGTNDGFFNENKRFSNINKLAEQLPGTNLPQYAMNSNALSKADSVYSSNNVPVIRDLKTKRARPLSMKQPRKLRQKIDEKYLKNSDGHHDTSMPTVWNMKNPNPSGITQVPFKNVPSMAESSFMEPHMVKSPEFSNPRFESNREEYEERTGMQSPSAVLDLTKPVLSLRNMTKDSVHKEFVNKARQLKLASKGKRGSTMISVGTTSVISAQESRTRIRTREGKRPFRGRDFPDTITEVSRRKGHKKSPSDARPGSKNRNLRIKKKKMSKVSNKLPRRDQAGEKIHSPEKSEDSKSHSQSRLQLSQNHSFSMKHMNNQLDYLNPPKPAYIQIEEPQNQVDGNPPPKTQNFQNFEI